MPRKVKIWLIANDKLSKYKYVCGLWDMLSEKLPAEAEHEQKVHFSTDGLWVKKQTWDLRNKE
jgi:hypothetical protein